MQWITKLSTFFSAAMILVILSPSLQSFPPAEAIRSSYLSITSTVNQFSFRKALSLSNAHQCQQLPPNTNICNPSLVHIAMTLDISYLRGSVAAVHSILQHSFCPENIFFHFLVSDLDIDQKKGLIQSIFPDLKFKFYYFDPSIVSTLISTSVRQALEQPLNYVRNYLAEILETCVSKVIYLDSDIIVVDDIGKLWLTDLQYSTIGAPEYCYANITNYFTAEFWSDKRFSTTFDGRRPCYFNTGVMVMDLVKWRKFGYTQKIERWMEIQKNGRRIYELGSLPPFLLVFAGHVAPIEHRWNQHGLGGDNVKGSCRNLHPGPVSLLHWSGSGKPWIRVDENRPCPLDSLWTPYDLYGPAEK